MAALAADILLLYIILPDFRVSEMANSVAIPNTHMLDETYKIEVSKMLLCSEIFILMAPFLVEMVVALQIFNWIASTRLVYSSLHTFLALQKIVGQHIYKAFYRRSIRTTVTTKSSVPKTLLSDHGLRVGV